jgi:hypothetical protein
VEDTSNRFSSVKKFAYGTDTQATLFSLQKPHRIHSGAANISTRHRVGNSHLSGKSATWTLAGYTATCQRQSRSDRVNE